MVEYMSGLCDTRSLGHRDAVYFLDSLHTFPNVTLVAGRGDPEVERPALPYRFRLNKLVLSSASMTMKNLLCDYVFNETMDDSVTIMTEIDREHLELFRDFLVSGYLRTESLDDGVKESFLSLGVNLDGLVFELAEKPQEVKFEADFPPMVDYEVYQEVEEQVEVALQQRKRTSRKRVNYDDDLMDMSAAFIPCKDEPMDDTNEDFFGLDDNAQCDVQIEENEYEDVEKPPKKKRGRKPKAKNKEPKEGEEGNEEEEKGAEVKRHYCRYCDFSHKLSGDLRLHELKHESTNPNHDWFCIFCEQGFEAEASRDDHVEINHPDKKFKCQYCGEMYLIYWFYQKHVDQHGGSRLLPCIQCGKEFARKKLYKLHACDMGDYHNNSCVQCTDKVVKFRSWKEHKEHLDTVHNGVYKFVCGICPQVFDSEKLMKEHKKFEHPAGKRFQICNMCGITVKSVLVKTHMFTQHGIGEPPPQRTVKRKKFVSNKIVCEVCAKSVEKVLMKKHMYDKHGTEQIQCPKCPKILKSQPSLKDHIDASHSQFPCDICGKPQRNKQMYQHHIGAMHTPDGQKPYQCSYCPKGFGRKIALREHENIHTNNKPHKCRFPDCGIGFSAISNRTNHEKSVHGGYRRPKRAAIKAE